MKLHLSEEYGYDDGSPFVANNGGESKLRCTEVQVFKKLAKSKFPKIVLRSYRKSNIHQQHQIVKNTQEN